MGRSIAERFQKASALVGRQSLHLPEVRQLPQVSARAWAALLLAGVMTIALASPATAAAGDLDPTFGGDGEVVTGFADTAAFANAVAIQADGKIVAAGSGFALARYNTDGSLDDTFGGDGKVAPRVGGDAQAVAIQADGKIVAAGHAGFRFAVARYNPDGSLDDTFSGDGKVLTGFPGEAYAMAVAIQPDGQIVVTGGTGVRPRFALARYNTDGTLDATFGGDGKVLTGFVTGGAGARAIAIQAAGGIVVGGVLFPFTRSPSRFALAQYHADGTIDAAFGGDGKVVTRFVSFARVEAVAIQADTKTVAAGTLFTKRARFALTRYDIDGTLDATFGTKGKVLTEFPGHAVGEGAALQSDGKIVVAGWTATVNRTRFALARYLAS